MLAAAISTLNIINAFSIGFADFVLRWSGPFRYSDSELYGYQTHCLQCRHSHHGNDHILRLHDHRCKSNHFDLQGFVTIYY